MNTKVAKKNNKGFTLIELIVVIAIIAVLAAILAPQYLRYVEKSRVTSDEVYSKRD
ncbi:MAG: prepilin-type N-terminal cleavage/methylation domain-containing protein [Lachnospiraceae bacterium]|nr:prepilin-type N-terminal cleavage/methylation domain-containing protein [Lachnospiraceae bacterium]